MIRWLLLESVICNLTILKNPIPKCSDSDLTANSPMK